MKSEKVEQWLDRQGVNWGFKDKVALKDFDMAMSQRNQARFDIIDQDWVCTLALHAQDAGGLEAVVVYQDKRGKFVIIDGNHRILALDLARITATDCYQVNTASQDVIERLTFTANLLNGKPPKVDDVLAHAYFMVVNRGCSIRETARYFYLKESKLNGYYKQRSVQERLTTLGFHKRLDPSKLQSLYRIRQDAPLLGAAKLIAEANLTLTQLDEMIDILEKHKGSEKTQIDMIDNFRKIHHDTVEATARGQLHIRYDNRQKLFIHMDGILRLKDENITPIDNMLVAKARTVIALLEVLCKQGTVEK